MPCAGPDQPMRSSGTSSPMVDAMSRPAVLQWKTTPAASGPSRLARLTSCCHSGHAAISVSTFQTVLRGAAMTISSRVITGALRLMSNVILLHSLRTNAQCRCDTSRLAWKKKLRSPAAHTHLLVGLLLRCVEPVRRVLVLTVRVRGVPGRQGVAHVRRRAQRRAFELPAAAVRAWAHQPQ